MYGNSAVPTLDTILSSVYGIGMNTTTFTDKAPTFHQRAVRAMESQPPTKATEKKLAEMRETGRQRGWND